MNRLFGHEPAVHAYRAALQSKRLHHAWLIAGPRGVGKRAFAMAAALRTLTDPSGTASWPDLDVPAEEPQAQLFAAESHPDFHLVEREAWDKKKKDQIIPKHERSGSDDLGRNIRVVQIRGINQALSRTTSMSARRVVLIDSMDDLEAGAANALLKNLEEPPPSTVFLLISHAPDRLLPTIRSRCRMLRLAPLADDVMASALRALLEDADEKEIVELVQAGEGAPGRAIAFRGLDIGALDRSMEELARNGDPTGARRFELAQSLGSKAAQPRFEAFLDRAPSRIAAAARERQGADLNEAVRLWERASSLAAAARRHSFDPQAITFELAGMLAALAGDRRDRAS